MTESVTPTTTVERLLLAPTAAVRAYVILRGTLIVLSVDVWMTLLGPAWRYGAAGFSVPHFEWMRALPMVTTGAYVGGLALVSALSLLAALLERPPRWLLLAIAALYTWGWSSSMLDSYQHHYLLSWVLVSLAAFPVYDATALFGPPADGAIVAAFADRPVARTHALGPKLVWILAAVVYAYTAVSKTEPEWASGGALRNITRDGESIEGTVAFFSRLGWAGDDFWWLMGHGTIAVQVACTLGYLAALVRDSDVARTGWLSRTTSVVTTGALFAAVSFHIGAEYLGLEIGWFSYYMILFAFASFVPARWLSRAVAGLTWPSRALAARASSLSHPAILGTIGLTAAVTLLFSASESSLPGVTRGAWLAVFVAAIVAVVARVRSRGSREPLAAALAVLGAGIVMSLALHVGYERFDYWRFAGGDFRRRGETGAALEAYRNALRYAPEHDEDDEDGDDRGAAHEPPRERMARRVRELEARLAAEAH